MDGKVKINYNDIEVFIKEILAKLNDVSLHATNLEKIANSNSGWNSAFEKTFHDHIRNETVPSIEKILHVYVDYISQLEKNIKGYQKLDRY